MQVIEIFKDNSGQSYSNNGTLSWNTQETSTDGALNGGTGVFTAPRAGLVQVDARAGIISIAASQGQYASIALEKNGTKVFYGRRDTCDANTTRPFTFDLSTSVYVNQGDTLEIVAVETITTGGSTLIAGTESNRVSFVMK
jgi:hypothetical protein